MGRSLLSTIKWHQVTKTATYLYGTTMTFLDNQVIFENLLMASGKTLNRWESRTSYQRDRYSPDLPLLEPEKTYYISSKMTCYPQNSIFIRLDFFNRMGELLDFAVIRKQKGRFIYPKDAFTYTISLINGGGQFFIFKEIAIYSLDDCQTSDGFTSNKNKQIKNLPRELDLVKPLLLCRQEDKHESY